MMDECCEICDEPDNCHYCHLTGELGPHATENERRQWAEAQAMRKIMNSYCIECDEPIDPYLERYCPLCGEGSYCSEECLNVHLRRYPSHRDPEEKELIL